MGEASRKVEDGKLVRVRVDDDGSVSVTGDFFLHPEEAIEGLEDALADVAGSHPSTVVAVVQGYLDEADAELLGADADDLAELLLEARDDRN